MLLAEPVQLRDGMPGRKHPCERRRRSDVVQNTQKGGVLLSGLSMGYFQRDHFKVQLPPRLRFEHESPLILLLKIEPERFIIDHRRQLTKVPDHNDLFQLGLNLLQASAEGCEHIPAHHRDFINHNRIDGGERFAFIFRQRTLIQLIQRFEPGWYIKEAVNRGTVQLQRGDSGRCNDSHPSLGCSSLQVLPDHRGFTAARLAGQENISTGHQSGKRPFLFIVQYHIRTTILPWSI